MPQGAAPANSSCKDLHDLQAVNEELGEYKHEMIIEFYATVSV